MRAFNPGAGTRPLPGVGGMMTVDSWTTVVSQHPPNALLWWWSRSDVRQPPEVLTAELTVSIVTLRSGKLYFISQYIS